MKRMKASLAVMMTLVICFSYLLLPLSATDARLSHLSAASFGFYVGEDGGEASVTYEAYRSSFVKAAVTFKLQKKYLLFFWEDLSEWSAISTDVIGSFVYEFPVNSKGTYKMNMSFAVMGNDGSVDVIEDSLERTYS